MNHLNVFHNTHNHLLLDLHILLFLHISLYSLILANFLVQNCFYHERTQVSNHICSFDYLTYCHKKFLRPISKVGNSKSGLYFCCREHKDLAQRLSGGEQYSDIRPEHYSIVTNEREGTIHTYRTLAFQMYKNECAVCGWNEDIDILQVHHIDENRSNNHIENLIILCPNCHMKLTSHKYILLDRTKIVLK